LSQFLLAPGQFSRETKLIDCLQILETGMAKIAPWSLASRDTLLAKVSGLVIGVTAPPTLSAHTRNRWR
jgi:hypothetical protein